MSQVNNLTCGTLYRPLLLLSETSTALSTTMRNKTAAESNSGVTRDTYPSVYFEILGRQPDACNTSFERAELELLGALDALDNIQDTDDELESAQNAGKHDFPHSCRSIRAQELHSRYELARKNYKAELWNRDFEPVLQRILAATATATINADWEGDAQTEAVRRLVMFDSVLREEKDVLDGLVGNFVQMGDMLEELKVLLGTSNGSRGSQSDTLHGSRKQGDMKSTPGTQGHDDRDLEALPSAKLLETTPKLDSQREHNICSGPEMSHGDKPTTRQADENFTAPTICTPLMMSELGDSVTKQMAIAQLRAENAALRAAMDRETEQLNAMFAEVQFRNEEDLSLAATLLMEATEVRAQAERIRAATKSNQASLGFREVERRNSAT